jgi:hypothetical protein
MTFNAWLRIHVGRKLTQTAHEQLTAAHSQRTKQIVFFAWLQASARRREKRLHLHYANVFHERTISWRALLLWIHVFNEKREYAVRKSPIIIIITNQCHSITKL